MKISSVDIIKFKEHPEHGQTPVLVRINTDEGIYGYGEAGVSIGNYSLGSIEILKGFAKMILGRNPLENDVIYEKIANAFWSKGNGGVIFAAVSAIDAALWDIKGKYFNKPVYELLGGAHRTKIRAYASQLQNGWKYENFLGSPGDLGFLKNAVQSAVDEGYDAVKIDFLAKHLDGSRIDFYEGRNHLSLKTLKEVDQKLDAVKQIIDGKAELILENHSITTAHTAIQFAKVAEDYSPLLLEEPADPLDIHDYERIKEATNIPLATGERTYTRRGFLPFLERNVLDVLQPDLGNCGGITEGRKIADLAELYGVSIQTHTCNTSLSVAIALHLEAAIPNFIIHEHHTSNTFRHNREEFIYDYQPVNGYFDLPSLPGLGNEPTEKTLAESTIITVK